MTDITRQTNFSYAIWSAPQTQGEAILRLGALLLLIVETISVGSGIIEAIRMTLAQIGRAHV
jgi:hypothetical protein